jgi:hypothetical protein
MGVAPPREETSMDTARQRVIKALEEHPDGMSKRQLREHIGGNVGAFRRLIQNMLDRGEITVEEVDFPNWGPTKMHKLAEEQKAA